MKMARIAVLAVILLCTGAALLADNNEKLFQETLKKAEAGDAQAQYLLGVMYADGNGVQQDELKSLYWYSASAIRGNANAQVELARICHRFEEYEDAAAWFTKAAEQGHAAAQASLGMSYLVGQGVPQDDKEGAKWIILAANQGNPSGQNVLGMLYDEHAERYGLKTDYKESVKWFTKSAEQGDIGAQYNLGNMYAIGRGVPKDYVLAYKWHNLAAAQGYEKAKKNRDILHTMMTPQQIAEAQRLSREFRKVDASPQPVLAPQQKQESNMVRHTNNDLGFSIEVPKDWHTSRTLMSQAFAPKHVTIEKVGGQEVLKQFATQNGETSALDTEEGAIIDELFAGFRPRHEGTFQWVSISNAGGQKSSVMRTSRSYIRGTQLFDETYKASEPKEVKLAGVGKSCAYFTETMTAGNSKESGLCILIPHDDGYFLLLQFRSDPKSFGGHLKSWWEIANSLRVFSAD